MRGYDCIIVRAPLWLSHSGAKDVGRNGCWTRVVPSQSAFWGHRILPAAMRIMLFLAKANELRLHGPGQAAERGPHGWYSTLLHLGSPLIFANCYP
jgi:hypothetical protein